MGAGLLRSIIYLAMGGEQRGPPRPAPAVSTPHLLMIIFKVR